LFFNTVNICFISNILSVFLASVEMGFHQLLKVNTDLHTKILCYEPIWIEELKEYLKQYKLTISMQKLMSFLDDKVNYFT